MTYNNIDDIYKDLTENPYNPINNYDYFYWLGKIDACYYCGIISSNGRVKLSKKLEEIDKLSKEEMKNGTNKRK